MGSIYFTKRLLTKRPKPGPKAPEKPRAFRSEASAQDWAKKHGLKKFRVDAIAGGRKFKIRTRF
ncbi:hypothetical protein JW898_02055 [Candidatus Woesearchaeota archaeon]|nr:hypothetical protein [Candidatus Woesearchaeota archaeon]